jgi:ligand-binding SRPBCC domain-containing protein
MYPAPGGRTTGHVTGGDTVRWKGWQLGFPNFHVSLIPPDTFAPPKFFQDRMIAGRFRAFQHDHHFDETVEGTLLRDEVRYSMPFGAAGALVGRVVLQPHIRGLMHRRFHLLKRLAETDEWRQYLSG